MGRRNILPHQGAREVEDLAGAVRDGQRQRNDTPFGDDGRLLKDVRLEATSAKEVAHGLKRRPRGWFPVTVRADASAEYPVQAKDPDRELLYLHNYGASVVVCDIWVW